MTELTLEILRSELAPIRADITAMRDDIAAIRPAVDGIPFIHRTVGAIRQDVRMLHAAFNDFALTNVTAGEIQALHTDVNAVQIKADELEVKIATLQRLVAELQSKS